MYSNSFKFKIYHTSLAIIIALLSSCQNDLTIEIKTNDKRLIVVGEFTTDSVVHTANLYLASSLITGKPQTVVSAANIYITNHTDTIYYIESDTIPGLYQTPGKCRGIGGQEYYLYINNVDIDNDGKSEIYTAMSLLPNPIQFDSLKSFHGFNGDGPMLENNAYYTFLKPGPDYVYNFMNINQNEMMPIENRLGSGEFSQGDNEYRIYNANNQSYNSPRSFFLEEGEAKLGDTLTFIGYNFTKEQYDFLIAFDNNTEGDIYQDNFMDKLNVPSNVPTNIVPGDKAAGFFLIYSISRISKVFNE